jgi:hypothetical protein
MAKSNIAAPTGKRNPVIFIIAQLQWPNCPTDFDQNWLNVFFQCHHMSLMDFVVSPPGCGRSVTDFWGWDAHEAHVVPMRWMVISEYEVPGGALNLNYMNYPDHGHPFKEKSPW